MNAAGPDYRAAFDAATPRFYPGEAEYEFARGDRDLTVSLPTADDETVPGALESARSLLARLDALDEEAILWLRSQPGWPYGDDVILWLLLVEPGNVRFCYRQETVNDEQVIGFIRNGDNWLLTGPDPRYRAPVVAG